MEDFRERERVWLDENPLRQWRLKNKLRQRDIGAALGIGFHVIYQWETGMAYPPRNRMASLVALTKDDKLAEKFQHWRDKRPLLGKE